MTQPLRFLFLEPFYGGSHRDFADGLTAHSRHDIHLVTLPDRFWKWRMRGAAIYWSNRIENPMQYDGLIVSSKNLKTSCPICLDAKTDMKRGARIWPPPWKTMHGSAVSTSLTRSWSSWQPNPKC